MASLMMAFAIAGCEPKETPTIDTSVPAQVKQILARRALGRKAPFQLPAPPAR